MIASWSTHTRLIALLFLLSPQHSWGRVSQICLPESVTTHTPHQGNLCSLPALLAKIAVWMSVCSEQDFGTECWPNLKCVFFLFVMALQQKLLSAVVALCILQPTCIVRCSKFLYTAPPESPVPINRNTQRYIQKQNTKSESLICTTATVLEYII